MRSQAMSSSMRNFDVRCMLITNTLEVAVQGGRSQLCNLNHLMLQSIYGDRLQLLELTHAPLNSLKQRLNAFRGFIDGVTRDSINRVIAIIKKKSINQIFVDGSNLGRLALEIKRRFPLVEVISFFHNVEARFFWGAFRSTLSLRALSVVAANFFAERLAVRWSDKCICLNERDSLLLKRLYGRGATHISAMALEDKQPIGKFVVASEAHESFALFVGGKFYANQEGILWFVKYVVPLLDIKVCVVGRGLESLRDELEVPGKVEVIGGVRDLSSWYANAKFVIAPIFDGSGMKTKVAEALMHGKRIVGTPEAFSGYEDIISQAGWVCETRDQFVSAIINASEEITESFDMGLRRIYEERYSMAAATLRMKKILS